VAGRGRSTPVGTPGNDALLSHQSLVRWDYDGHTVYDEDQDVWDPVQWRAFRRGIGVQSAGTSAHR